MACSVQTLTKRHKAFHHHLSHVCVSIKRNMCSQMKLGTPIIINGRQLASDVFNAIPSQIVHFEQTYNRVPGLAVIMVSYRRDSLVYTQIKAKKAKQLGIQSFAYHLNEEETTKASLITLIQELNQNNAIDGILLQLPLPPSLEEDTNDIVDHIAPMKDVDGLTSKNQGILTKCARSLIGSEVHNISYDAINRHNYSQYVNFACTPLAVMHILEYLESIDAELFRIQYKNVVMIGRSSLVGTPLFLMLSAKNATVTLCHSYTDEIPNNLNKHCQTADIIVVAAGCPNLITKESVKPGCVVIDVGINVIECDHGSKQRVIGDVWFNDVKDMTSAITPVPGGVGPLTVAMLFANTIRAAKCRELHNRTHVSNGLHHKL